MIHRPVPRPVMTLSAAIFLALAATGAAVGQEAESADTESGLAQGLAGPAVLAVVSLRHQRVALYDAAGNTLRARVSSGSTGYETPVGVYSVLQKKEEHYSNLYDDAAMPYMQRITWSGIALHAGELPGYPASHGCVRMPYGFAEQIFPQTRLGLRVVVAREDVAPVAISHPLLLKPAPVDEQAEVAATPTAYEPGEDAGGSPLEPDVRAWPARQAQLDALRSVAADKAAAAETAAEHAKALKAALKTKTSARAKAAKAVRSAEWAKRKADEKLARAERRLAGAKSDAALKAAEEAKTKAATSVVDAEAKLTAATDAAKAADEAHARATREHEAAEAAKTAAVSAAQEAKRKTFPVSLFVSLKAQRLYLRQGHEAVLDMPVTIADPETPIGTHVFTAVAYADAAGRDVRWAVVSLAKRAPDDTASGAERKQRKANKDAGPTPTDPAPALAALDRITLPPDVVARVSESVWPGSSLIVSDEDVSKETGKATDFVVLISGEPQGGIKKRPRQPPPDYFDRYYDSYYDDYYDRPRRARRSYRPFFSFW